MRAELAFLLVALLAPSSALAEIGWTEYDWNPQPMEDDVVLPMPCEGAMVFRRIETPVPPNWLADAPLQMGSSGVAGQEHSESLLSGNVVGGLAGQGPDARFYLLGKYEISRHQYRAVMEETCPQAADELALPAEGMSWLEAQQFAAAYTQWLYKNAREALWAATEEGAFLRLPTEEEWEFAARGGLAVTDPVRRKKLFPMDGPLQDYVWFSGFKSCGGNEQPIGVLNPNPLGLFDILGNVQEYTLDSYHLRTRERRHGQAGGIAARGGSCLTAEGRVRSAERDEVVPIDDQTGTPRGKPFTGLRLAAGAAILADLQRINKINEDWQSFGEMRIPLEPGQDPIEALGVIAEAEDNPQIRETLESAREIFLREMERRNSVEARSASSVAQAGLLAVRAYVLSLDFLAQADAVIAASPDDPNVAEWYRRGEERRQITENILLGAIAHAAEDFDAPTFDAALHLVGEENAARLAGMTAKTRETTSQMLRLFAEFVALYRDHSDTDPQVFVDGIAAYFDGLR